MPKDDEPNLGRFLGIGLQVLVGVVLGLLVGSWLDRKFGWKPWGALIGVALGMSGGMYLLIKEGVKANKD